MGTFYTAGWGRTQQGGQPSDVLLETELPGLDISVCKEAYKKNGRLVSERQFDDGVLCVGDLSGENDACQGKIYF